MKRLELGELAGFMSFEPTEFAWLLDHTCGWLCKEPAPLRISHVNSGDVGDRVVDSTRDLLAIAGIPELVRRQRSRIAHGILDALLLSCGIEPMSGGLAQWLPPPSRTVRGVQQSSWGGLDAGWAAFKAATERCASWVFPDKCIYKDPIPPSLTMGTG